VPALPAGPGAARPAPASPSEDETTGEEEPERGD
jgi:hypothetical protein